MIKGGKNNEQNLKLIRKQETIKGLEDLKPIFLNITDSNFEIIKI